MPRIMVDLTIPIAVLVAAALALPLIGLLVEVLVVGLVITHMGVVVVVVVVNLGVAMVSMAVVILVDTEESLHLATQVALALMVVALVGGMVAVG